MKMDILVNGKFVGEADDPVAFAEAIREKRRKNLLPAEMSVRIDEEREMIFITTETGRVIRPLIVVKNGLSLLRSEHLEMIRTGKMLFSDLVKQ